jgi:uncharacterized membrane protein (DUF373 family)
MRGIVLFQTQKGIASSGCDFVSFSLETVGHRRQNGGVRPGRGCDWLGGPMTSKILTLASEFRELHSKWQTLSIYERFEQLVVAVLTTVIALIIALATWQLLLHTLNLVQSHLVRPADSQIFQTLFGMVLTVLIAMEFKHTLLVVKHHRRAIVGVRSVVSIALLSLVRRFIILDLYQTTPSLIAALAGAALALGIVFWLVSNREEPQEVEAQEGFVKPDNLE